MLRGGVMMNELENIGGGVMVKESRYRVGGVNNHDVSIWSDDFRDGIEKMILKLKPKFSSEYFLGRDTFEADNICLHKGSRFQNDDMILKRVLSAVFDAHLDDWKQYKDAVIEAEDKALNFLDEITWDALKDCASADYHYKFEKDY